MASSNSSSTSSKTKKNSKQIINVCYGGVFMNNSTASSKTKKEAQSALDRFKMEVASEIGVNLKEGYNGDLTSAEAGSVGGNMVKKMIRKQEEQMSQGGN